MQIFKKILKIFLWGLGGLSVFILLLALSMLAPVKEKLPAEYPAVQSTLQDLEDVPFNRSKKTAGIRAGWAKVNITPEKPVDLAGYGPRGPFKSVLDSLFARIVLFDNDQNRAVFVSLDLLMFPRDLKSALEMRLAEQGFRKDQIFLSATHTHHGFGHWDQSIAGQFAFGEFDEKLIAILTKKIIYGIEMADRNKSRISMGFQKIDAGDMVINRLAPEEGNKDPFLRVVHLQKSDGQRAMLVSFSGHATNLDADAWELSRDFPGVLVDKLEAVDHIDFAMFAAGMVGSHNIDIDVPKGHERIQQTGEILAERILQATDIHWKDSVQTLGTLDVPIGLPDAQMRLTQGIRVRDWIFRLLFGPLQANIKALQIGDVLFVGMPCDYSGELSINNELDRIAAEYGKDLFITSFNGNYVGYITEDAHYYTCDHDEVKTMNWVGPGMGAYFTKAIRQIIQASKNDQ